jgi:hypothetical protein
MPVTSCTASSTAATVMIPPNPVLARLLSTAPFPLFRNDAMGRDMIVSSLRRHGKVPEMVVFGGRVAVIY